MSVTPIQSNVLVQVDEPEKVTESGLHLVNDLYSPTKTGTVLAAGPGYYTQNGVFVATTVKPGDRVLCPAYSGTMIDEKARHLIIDERLLLGLLTEETTTQNA